jgi:hypothetical protein
MNGFRTGCTYWKTFALCKWSRPLTVYRALRYLRSISNGCVHRRYKLHKGYIELRCFEMKDYKQPWCKSLGSVDRRKQD